MNSNCCGSSIAKCWRSIIANFILKLILSNKIRIRCPNKESQFDGVAPRFLHSIDALIPGAAPAAGAGASAGAAVALAHVGADEAELGAELLVSEAQLLQCVRCNNNSSEV